MKIGKILAVAAVATVFASCSNLQEYQDCLILVPLRLAHITLPQPTLM